VSDVDKFSIYLPTADPSLGGRFLAASTGVELGYLLDWSASLPGRPATKRPVAGGGKAAASAFFFDVSVTVDFLVKLEMYTHIFVNCM
jgi:hypothetical protein